MKGHEEVTDTNSSTLQVAENSASPGKPCTGFTLWKKAKRKLLLLDLAVASLKWSKRHRNLEKKSVSRAGPSMRPA